jgi:hypothetical protein
MVLRPGLLKKLILLIGLSLILMAVNHLVGLWRYHSTAASYSTAIAEISRIDYSIEHFDSTAVRMATVEFVVDGYGDRVFSSVSFGCGKCMVTDLRRQLGVESLGVLKGQRRTAFVIKGSSAQADQVFLYLLTQSDKWRVVGTQLFVVLCLGAAMFALCTLVDARNRKAVDGSD